MTKAKVQMDDIAGFHDAKQPKIKKYHAPTDESVAAAAAVVGLVEPTSEEAQEVIDLVNPGATEDGAGHTESIRGGVEDGAQVQYTLDPQMVQQAMQNRNARLIAMMVNENAMMEVALDQERAANNELRAKMRAMQEAFGVVSGAD